MTTSHVRLPSAVSLAPAAVRRHSGRHGHEWADRRAAEDERMRLVAALLVLGSLLVWILLLQG